MTRYNDRDTELSAADARRLLGRKTRRGLLTGALASAAGYSFYNWVRTAPEIENLPSPQRSVLHVNEVLSRAYLSDVHLMPQYPASKIGGVKPNGDYGLSDKVSASRWKVQVEHPGARIVRHVSLADIKAMPRTDVTTRFCCIEGWSGVAHWGGVRFADFTRAVLPSGAPVPAYVYMATADEEYYVGLDARSALHPQTLLAYEQNGKPLETERGAPLRLAIPVKYGIKNIKQVALIRYTDQRPDDYWAQEGYDWFAGL